MSGYGGSRSIRNVGTYIPVYIDCLTQSIIRLDNTADITWLRLEYKLKVSVNIESNYSILQIDHRSKGVEYIQIFE